MESLIQPIHSKTLIHSGTGSDWLSGWVTESFTQPICFTSVCMTNSTTINTTMNGCLKTIKGVMNCLCFLFSTVLWGPLIMLSRFLHQKHHNLKVIGYFLSCFNPPHQNAVWIGVADYTLWSKRPLLWLAYSCVCLTDYVLHRWTLQWFRLKRINAHIKWSV